MGTFFEIQNSKLQMMFLYFLPEIQCSFCFCFLFRNNNIAHRHTKLTHTQKQADTQTHSDTHADLYTNTHMERLWVSSRQAKLQIKQNEK